MNRITLTLVALLMTIGASQTSAEVLLLDSIQSVPPNSSAGLLRPRGGITMARVKQSFGDAQQEIPRVGEPPISRWVYPAYTVYFEHNLVLNTVVHR